MQHLDRNLRYCIIGAGASGLAVAKNFVQRGIPFDCLEREEDIGGLWNIATPSGVVYETTHLVSSISSTGYDDLPMLDEDYPEYPSHARVLGYLRDFARTFGLLDHIQFGKPVTEVAPAGNGTWAIWVAGEPQPRLYGGVILASGHHDAPRTPTYPGTFSGEILHSRAYKSPRQLRDKRLLVVGCGNSAADIVSDAAHNSSQVLLSLRRGYWFVPKFILGFPTGDVLSYAEMVPLPRLVRRWLFQSVLWLVQGPPSRYRMPDPDYSIDEAHPTMTDEIPRLVAHGDLVVKPEIAAYEGERVRFTDGSAETVDMVVFATGYQPVIPYIDERVIYAADGRPRLLFNVVHPEHEGLFAAGFAQANGSMWRLADYQGQLIANLIVAGKHAPERARAFRQMLATRAARTGRRTFVASDRHRLEVNYYDYRRLMKRLNRRFGPVRKMKLEQGRGAKSRSEAAAT
ncbi:MAG: NAD(P)-binding domain-containing protein [Hyphomicrobiaceae bacterium]|nr:NAD(P)-binding domain-containing protein [Hyphomicrobiaceae bacterium]